MYLTTSIRDAMLYMLYVCVYVCTYVYLIFTCLLTFLQITGFPTVIPHVAVDNKTIIGNENTVTLTLNWGEPFNNLDPIVNYIVSCTGDDACPSNFTTTDDTTRNYTINNLTIMTTYTFSVVATNSIGSGEPGVMNYVTPGEVKNIHVCMYMNT